MDRRIDWKKYLESIYFDPKHPGSYAGPDKLYKVVKSEGKYKIGKYRIRKWLQSQESYSLTRDARRHFPRNRVVVAGTDSQWDVDLADMSQLAKQNDGYKYLLMAVDVFSRFAWSQPLKSKEGEEVARGLSLIFKQGRLPKTIRTDKGREFRNKTVSKYLNNAEIHHFVTQNEPKSNYCERLIKTIKGKLFRFMMKQRSKRYIDVLQDVITSYNNTPHRSLGQSPSSINKLNEDESRLNQYLLRRHKGRASTKIEKKTVRKRKRRFKYKIGQVVRISHIRGLFDRSYSQKWTGELFKVDTRHKRENIPVYTLEDWSGDRVEGSFYESELQPVTVDENTEYHIEQILKKRTRNKQREVLVHWEHWPKKYDSWIPEKDVKQYS